MHGKLLLLVTGILCCFQHASAMPQVVTTSTIRSPRTFMTESRKTEPTAPKSTKEPEIPQLNDLALDGDPNWRIAQRLKGQNRQVYGFNGFAGYKKVSELNPMIEEMIRNAQVFYKNLTAVRKSDVYCWAQSHSARNIQEEGQEPNPTVFCHKGYSIRLNNDRDTALRVSCLDVAVKIASELTDKLKLVPAIMEKGMNIDSFSGSGVEWMHPIAPSMGRDWTTYGTSFWSEDPSWFIYIGRENSGKCTVRTSGERWAALEMPPLDPPAPKTTP